MTRFLIQKDTEEKGIYFFSHFSFVRRRLVFIHWKPSIKSFITVVKNCVFPQKICRCLVESSLLGFIACLFVCMVACCHLWYHSVVDDPVNLIDNLLHMGSHAFALCSYEKLFTSKYFDVIYLIISIFGLVVTREKSVSWVDPTVFCFLGNLVERIRSAIRLQRCLYCFTRVISNLSCRRLWAWDRRRHKSKWLPVLSPVWWSIATNRTSISQRTRHFTRRTESLFGDHQPCKSFNDFIGYTDVVPFCAGVVHKFCHAWEGAEGESGCRNFGTRLIAQGFQ
jgi:hypothetical protein